MLGGAIRGAWHDPGRTSVAPAGQPAPGRAAVSPSLACANARPASVDASSSALTPARPMDLTTVARASRGGMWSALPEVRRLDAERPEIDVSLAAVVDLVVADVEQQIPDRHLPLPERRVHLLEARRGDRRPQLVDAGRRVVPLPEQLGLRRRLRFGVLVPLAGDHSLECRHGHADELHGERREGTHATDGVAEELILG